MFFQHSFFLIITDFGEAREYDSGFQDETDIPESDMTADSGD